LLHTNFFPDLMQVCVFPLYICLIPAFKHLAPGVTAE
jgi:hypothetical protein